MLAYKENGKSRRVKLGQDLWRYNKVVHARTKFSTDSFYSEGFFLNNIIVRFLNMYCLQQRDGSMQGFMTIALGQRD